MDEVIRILNKVKPGIDFENEKDLIDGHILTSMEILMLVSELEEEFDIEIGIANVIPENFKSAEAIWKMIEQIQEEE